MSRFALPHQLVGLLVGVAVVVEVGVGVEDISLDSGCSVNRNLDHTFQIDFVLRGIGKSLVGFRLVQIPTR